MSSASIQLISRFVILVFFQVLVLNNINFLGYINPYLYILFIMLFPVRNNRTAIVFISFLLGLCIDIFSDSGGVHAAACVFVAYIRPTFLKFSFGTVYDYQTIKFNQTELSTRLTYFTLITVVHHLVLFSLEVFNISKIILILQKTLFSSIFTILLCLIMTILFSNKRK
ncbi:MAG: rod shape-determining protein MreD [Gelidibacter sp.]|nr:rod shape-determining protein MreD [Gelidibacter sp.]